MRTTGRALRPTLRAALFTGALLVGAVVAPSFVDPQLAHADDDPPVNVGSTLVARADCELQKVVIARDTKLEVTASTSSTVDVALPDGYVLHKVQKSRIRYFFDVVR